MKDAAVIMTCVNRHQWAEMGQYTEDGSISLGTCSGEGAADDPTCCRTCHEPALRISVIGGAETFRFKRRRKGARSV
jgi:hypothetical protein